MTANAYPVGTTARLPHGSHSTRAIDAVTTQNNVTFYRVNLLAEPFHADKWYSQRELDAVNAPVQGCAPNPAWSNLLHVDFTPRKLIASVTPLPSIIPLVEDLDALEAAAVVEQDAAYEKALAARVIAGAVVTPWLADLRRARNLLNEAPRGITCAGNPKALLTIRLELAEGRGIIAAALEALPEHADTLALAVGEASAAMCVDKPSDVVFLSAKAGYRVHRVIESMMAEKKARQQEAA